MTYSRGVFDDRFVPKHYFDHVRIKDGRDIELPTTERPKELLDGLTYTHGVPGVEVVRVPGNPRDDRDFAAIEAARLAVREARIAAEIDRPTRA